MERPKRRKFVDLPVKPKPKPVAAHDAAHCSDEGCAVSEHECAWCGRLSLATCIYCGANGAVHLCEPGCLSAFRWTVDECLAHEDLVLPVVRMLKDHAAQRQAQQEALGVCLG